jgi:protein involved in polysaccharide export with SLBB domain
MLSLIGKRAFLFFSILMLASCVSQEPFPVETASEQGNNQAYLLSVGETVKITTYDEETLTGEFNIGPDGMLAFPLLGNIKAVDLSPADLGLAITTALSDGFVNSPRVSVEVKNYRPIYVLGEVNKPGEYPYIPDMTALAAIAKADGFTYRAQQKRIYIKRSKQAEEVLTTLGSNTPVFPGDVIRVTERYF